MKTKQSENENDLEVEIGDMLAIHITEIDQQGITKSHFEIYPRSAVDKLKATSIKLTDVVDGYIESIHRQADKSVELLGELTVNDKHKRVKGVN